MMTQQVELTNPAPTAAAPTAAAPADPTTPGQAQPLSEALQAAIAGDKPETTTTTEAATTEGQQAEGEAKDPRLEKARAGADHAKRQSHARRRQAEEARQARFERSALEHQLQVERSERERLQKLARDYETLPAAELMRLRGVSPQEIVQQAVDATTPEGKIKALEARLALEAKARQEFEARQAQAAAKQQEEQSYTQLVSDIGDKAKYPTLAKLSKTRAQTIYREANEVVQAYHARTGQLPDYLSVLEYLETQYSSALKDEPTSNGATQGQTTAAPTAGNGAGQQSRTLSASMQQRTTVPQDWALLPPDEQLNAVLDNLRKGRGG